MPRDEFSPRTRRTLALRAAHFCSNPDCLKLTTGPHSDLTLALTTGHAAHIHAASPLGPRYDNNQTPQQRMHISNGLWLCRECGDIVDKDDAPHSPTLLRQWKIDHEALVSEVRTKGYSESLRLLQLNQVEPQVAKRIIALLEDRRALSATFDVEVPDRVRQSLDHLRNRLVDLRGDLTEGSSLDTLLLSLTKTIHHFFNAVEALDLRSLRCDYSDPDWHHFCDALATLRKSIGLQISNLASAYGIALSDVLIPLVPQHA